MRLYLIDGFAEHVRKIILKMILLCLVISTNIFAQEDNYTINNLTVDQGLSQNEVTSIIKDRTGFMWFATRGGLNRYDGKNFITFNSDPLDNNNTANIVNPSVERIYQTSDNKIWIGFKSGGLSSYDPSSGLFTSFYNPNKNTDKTCWGQRVISFFEDQNHWLWIGTWSDGLFIRRDDHSGFLHLLGNEQVGSVIQTRDKRVWAGTSTGLYVYSSKDSKFLPVPLDIKGKHIVRMVEDPSEPVIWMVGWGLGLIRFDYSRGIASQFIPQNNESRNSASYSITIDSSRQIWMGTWGGGLYKFSQTSAVFEKISIKPQFQRDQNIDYDVILDLYFDKQGILWIGTDGGGVCQLIQKRPFSSLTYPDGLLNTHVLCLGIDSQNTLWIGTRGGGLYFSRDRQSVHLFSDNLINNKIILSLFQAHNKTFWIGLDNNTGIIESENGKYRFIQASEKFKNKDFAKLRKVLCFLEDKNTIWMGTQENGLYIFEKTGMSYRLKRHFLPSPEKEGALKNERISGLFKDSENRIWVGTYGGLHFFSRSDSSFIPVDKLIANKKTLTSDIILYINQDYKKDLWVATPYGLNKLTCVGYNRFDAGHYTSKDGLADNYIHSILIDRLNNLWISTNSGISEFNSSREKFINYGITDGLPGRTYSEAAAYRSADNFYFGGINGITFFNPSQIIENKKVPDIRFTSLAVFNHEVKVGETINNRVILPVSLEKVRDLKFTYRDREVTFGFAALNYISSEKNRYAYKLEGYNNDWVYLGNRSFVSFNNLKPGAYVLRIQGSNNNNIWNENGISLNFKVLPPPWKTWYAYIIYAILIVLFAFLVWSATFKRLQLEQKIEIEKMRTEQEIELNKLKIDFFTSISHEIRTPLTLIFAPLQELIARYSRNQDEVVIQKLNLISLNAKKLMNLINQLLDFRKIESNKMEIRVSGQNINLFAEETCIPYKELAVNDKKKLVLDFQNKQVQLWFDKNLMEIILNNLLSNAFKFCPENGTVKLIFRDDESNFYIEVIDDGPGIPFEEIDKIFNRFYQSKLNRSIGGTGIGLFLVKELVMLHHGDIEVKCQSGETIFRIKLPKGTDHFTKEQIIQSSSTDSECVKSAGPLIKKTLPLKEPSKNSQHKILIIDDNKELRDYLEDMFGADYIIITADNGLDGYQLIVSERPNLVISDITMPKLDGLELCKRVKSNDQLRNIPFLLLTARNADHYVLLGTKYGADDYITKPFNYEILKRKVENLITSRMELIRQYSQKLVLEPTELEISNQDELFLKKVLDLIEKNIGNSEFNPVSLASMVNMSQSSLYRRLRSVTNQTVNELIRDMRIKRAAQFLSDKHKSISEIAYEVGFNDVKYFRSCFQKLFGKSPSEFRKTVQSS